MSGWDEMKRRFEAADLATQMAMLGGMLPAWPEWVVRTVRNPVRGSRLSKRERRSRKMWWMG